MAGLQDAIRGEVKSWEDVKTLEHVHNAVRQMRREAGASEGEVVAWGVSDEEAAKIGFAMKSTPPEFLEREPERRRRTRFKTPDGSWTRWAGE